jgi:hypothetical protein
MEELQQSTDIGSESVGPESSAPVSDSAPSNAAPVSTDVKFGASMEATYDRIERGGNKRQYPEVHSSEEALPSEANPATATPPNSIGNRVDPATWAQTPAPVRELIAAREREAQQRLSEQGREIAQLKATGGSAELGNVIGKYSNHIPRGPDGNPMSPPVILESLLQAHSILEQDPQTAIQWLANSYGVNLGALAQDPQAAQYQAQLVGHFQQEAQRIQQEVAQLRASQSQLRHQRQQYLQTEILRLIDGKENWNEIEPEVVRQLEAVRSQDPSAYELDSLRAVREAIERAEKITGVHDKKAAEEARKKALEAKRLASLNVRSVVGKSPTGVSKDIWSNDSWGASYDKAQRRG